MTRAFVLALALLVAACARHDANVLQGYGEADYVYLAAQDGGVVSQIAVREGDVVQQGAPLFSLAPDRLGLSARSAAAEAASAEARTSHSGSLAQAVAAAEADAALARSNLSRTQDLFTRGFAPRAKLDADRAAAAAAEAQLRQARAERDAATREVNAARAQSSLAAQRVSDLSVTAPANGSVERIYHRAGEVVGAGDPVIALLPPGNMKVRFYAPEPMLARLRLGQSVALSCDSCADGLTARISFIAREPQFTPPVIYSPDERDKLVFLIEARPDRPDAIRPGLPVSVNVAAR